MNTREKKEITRLRQRVEELEAECAKIKRRQIIEKKNEKIFIDFGALPDFATLPAPTLVRGPDQYT